MECYFRRRRVLKTLLSFFFVVGTVVTIHKLKMADERLKRTEQTLRVASGLLPQSENTFWKSNSLSYNNSASASLLEGAAVGSFLNTSNLTSSVWDIRRQQCFENSSLKAQDWFKRLDVRFQQYVLYRHCRYFPMLHNHPEKCQGDIYLLIVIKSMTEQHDRREAIRKTWGKEQNVYGKKIRTLFLLGIPSMGKDVRNLQQLIEYEDRLYGDILQWDFMDTFFNLTLKEINFLRWFSIYCHQVQFIFKGDDDIFLHTKNLLDFIDFKKDHNKVSNLFIGDTIAKAIPIRSRQSKYYVPKELYDNKLYPIYAGGGGFLMASTLAKKLFTVSEEIQLYPIDDVFLGMCLQKIGVLPEPHPGFKTFGIVKRKNSAMNNDPCLYRGLLVVHKLSPEELLKMWETVHHGTIICAKSFHII
ncbi:UDP-GlcNAc:betaGal beta-1,3-N-acetylglucosaminyltransferase 7-like [Protopterus annectens]|uniref:UDP-GlcNAc:betaGal beta-1,3-N-acetylglucosaminyltransferase 7-like n=1 Tax=Protopterus annectens TaxID=7888 RepID=UPI001CFBC855|nr:UDP-GlcNAc:betaGal beta-1,3-N-acetylglucosaminyltransferase 7-like [Protopterus annectens]